MIVNIMRMKQIQCIDIILHKNTVFILKLPVNPHINSNSY